MPDPQKPETGAELDGDLALPRQNGELLFQAPWEARAFGIALALNQGGRYPWRDFSAELARQIAAGAEAGEPEAYYRSWLRGLERLIDQKGLVETAELRRRAEGVAAEDDHRH